MALEDNYSVSSTTGEGFNVNFTPIPQLYGGTGQICATCGSWIMPPGQGHVCTQPQNMPFIPQQFVQSAPVDVNVQVLWVLQENNRLLTELLTEIRKRGT